MSSISTEAQRLTFDMLMREMSRDPQVAAFFRLCIQEETVPVWSATRQGLTITLHARPRTPEDVLEDLQRRMGNYHMQPEFLKTLPQED